MIVSFHILRRLGVALQRGSFGQVRPKRLGSEMQYVYQDRINRLY